MAGKLVGLVAFLYPSVPRTRRAFAMAVLFLAVCPLSLLQTETVHEAAAGFTVIVEQDGCYTIRAADPSWTFSRSLPTRASDLKTTPGDGIGDFHEISFTFSNAREGSIRTYPARAALLFTDRHAEESPNVGGFPKLTVSPTVPFPLSLSFLGKWATFHFDLSSPEGPWVNFDDADHQSAGRWWIAHLKPEHPDVDLAEIAEAITAILIQETFCERPYERLDGANRQEHTSRHPCLKRLHAISCARTASAEATALMKT